MTTNGVLLAEHIDALVEAGLDRLTSASTASIPDDSRDHAPERPGPRPRRLAACERHARLGPIKVNAVILRGLSEPDVLPLARLARERPYVVRFIETMPIDAGRTWPPEQVIPGEELRAMIGAAWPLRELPRTRPSAPGRRWRFADGCGELEFVSSVSEPFAPAATGCGSRRTAGYARACSRRRRPIC